MPRTLTQTTFDFSAEEIEKVSPAAQQPVKAEIARERKSQLMAKSKSEPAKGSREKVKRKKGTPITKGNINVSR
jgi:hypothetical protein